MSDDEEYSKVKTKKIKIDVIETAWGHYRNYCEDEEGIDELMELLEVLKEAKVLKEFENNNDYHNNSLLLSNNIKSRTDLLPVLISVASNVLAEHAITELLAIIENTTTTKSNNNNDNEEINELRESIHQDLKRSIQYFPYNAAAWSMATNYTRMMTKNNNNSNNIIELLANCYSYAAKCVNIIRNQSLDLLECNTTPDECKEWIELLLVNQVSGVELVMGTENNNNNNDETTTDEQQQQQDEDEWSASAVEGTARFMSAMLYSMIGRHDIVKYHLQYFTSLTHRLHPNVWNIMNIQNSSNNNKLIQQQQEQEQKSTLLLSMNEPCIFPYNNILPDDIYERLCNVFNPDSIYWKESNYSTRGYFSYFSDLPNELITSSSDNNNNQNIIKFNVTNLIEDIVCTYLLPLAKQRTNEIIVGYEWWVHTRPILANLGHNLHFDTDEALLSQNREITHPVISSVLYLTGDNISGATILLNQTPDSKTNADKVWYNIPSNNTYLTFPGNLLHGVLPCPGYINNNNNNNEVTQTNDDATKNNNNNINLKPNELLSKLTKIWDDMTSSNDDDNNNNNNKPSSSQSNINRLTFMVGFWSRRVPDRMKDRKLYGPCGPIPTPTKDSNTWVNIIQKGYPIERSIILSDDDHDSNNSKQRIIAPVSLPFVTPAWEEINIGNKKQDNDDEPVLVIPRGIDHRFFVTNSPQCFRDSLFEKDYEDNTNDNDNNDNDDNDDNDESNNKEKVEEEK